MKITLDLTDSFFLSHFSATKLLILYEIKKNGRSTLEQLEKAISISPEGVHTAVSRLVNWGILSPSKQRMKREKIYTLSHKYSGMVFVD